MTGTEGHREAAWEVPAGVCDAVEGREALEALQAIAAELAAIRGHVKGIDEALSAMSREGLEVFPN